jgi:hypothetical protein
VERTGCVKDTDKGDDSPLLPVLCVTGDALPVTVVQASVDGKGGVAAYSVSLLDCFNVAVMLTPHELPPEGARRGRRCPTLGCAVDLATECPPRDRGGAVQALVPRHADQHHQDCVDPGEIKVIFFPKPRPRQRRHRPPLASVAIGCPLGEVAFTRCSINCLKGGKLTCTKKR